MVPWVTVYIYLFSVTTKKEKIQQMCNLFYLNLKIVRIYVIMKYFYKSFNNFPKDESFQKSMI